MLFGHSITRVCPDVSSQGSQSKVSNAEASQLETAGQLEGIQCEPGSVSWYEGSEFVSEYTGYQANIVWSGREHLGTHEYVDEPLD